jgi:hypothetical protein
MRRVQLKEAVMSDEPIVDVGRPSGGTPRWLIVLAVIVAIIGGAPLLNQLTDSDARRNSAVAEAAHDVGSAASKAGDAAEKAADRTADKAAPQN